MSAREEVPKPSERSFGKTFAMVFALVAGWALWTHRPIVAGTCAALAVATALAAAMRPSLLALPNRLWFQLSLLLHKVVSPIVLGVMYFVVLTPIAWIMRLAGRDVLDRRFEPGRASYWKPREPPGPERDSFDQQF